GAFDSFGDRGILVANLDIMVKYAQKIQKEKATGQTDLFGNSVDGETMMPKLLLGGTHDFSAQEQLRWERELTGLYLSRHPLSDYETKLKGCISIADIGKSDEGKP